VNDYTPSEKENDLQPFTEAIKRHFEAPHVFVFVMLKEKSLFALATEDATNAITDLPKLVNSVLSSASNGALTLLMKTPFGVTPVPLAGTEIWLWVTKLNEGKGEGVN
jgi:hypothetical protein